MKKFLRVVTLSLKRWWSADPVSLGATVSFFALFSFTPLVSLILLVFSSIVPIDILKQGITETSYNYAGATIGQSLQQFVVHAYTPENRITNGIIGFVTLLFGALGVLSQIQISLERLWNIQRRRGLGEFMSQKFVSLLLMIVLGFVFVVAICASFGGSVAASLIEQQHPEWYAVGLIPFSQIFSAVSGIFVIYLLYKYLPRHTVGRKARWIGSCITALLFIGGVMVFQVYFIRYFNSSLYGALGTLAALMIWMYYSAQIFFFGAALTYELDFLFRKDEILSNPHISHLQ
jgi:membrane protein